MKSFCISLICFVLVQFPTGTADAIDKFKWGSTSTHSGLYTNTKSITDTINRVHGQRFEITVVETKGFADNLKKIKGKSIHLGPAGIIEASAAYNGLKSYKNQPITELRSLWGGYITPIHIVTSKKSGITSIDKLHKAPFAMNPGTTSGSLLKRFFEAQGVQPAYKNFSIATSIDAMQSEAVKGWYKAGFKDAALLELEDMMNINILPVTAEMMAKTNAKYPGHGLSITVPKNLYRALKKDQRSLAYVVSDFVHKDLSEDTVFKIVEVIWERKQNLVNANRTLREGRFAEMYQTAIDFNLTVPFHKGAVRFYREVLNLTIPAELIPPELKTAAPQK